MRKRVALLLLLLAGCASPAPAVLDAVDDPRGDAAPRFDIVGARVTELNGSLAVRVELADFSEGIPRLEVRLGHDGGQRYARLVPDASTLSGLRAEEGRWDGTARHDAVESCWDRAQPTRAGAPGPWYVRLEFLHDRSGLSDGGIVRSIHVFASAADEVRDEARGSLYVPVSGLPNPYGVCPLARERDQ